MFQVDTIPKTDSMFQVELAKRHSLAQRAMTDEKRSKMRRKRSSAKDRNNNVTMAPTTTTPAGGAPPAPTAPAAPKVCDNMRCGDSVVVQGVRDVVQCALGGGRLGGI
eukprot:sb/3477573/